jgi:hypothetical protein
MDNSLVPPMDPKKALKFASFCIKLSFVSLRILGSALTSETAASIATLATLPITELKVKIAPMFTTAGLWQYTEPVRNTHIKIVSGRTTNCFILATTKPILHNKDSNFSQTKLAQASKSGYPDEFKRPEGLSTNMVA